MGLFTPPHITIEIYYRGILFKPSETPMTLTVRQEKYKKNTPSIEKLQLWSWAQFSGNALGVSERCWQRKGPSIWNGAWALPIQASPASPCRSVETKTPQVCRCGTDWLVWWWNELIKLHIKFHETYLKHFILLQHHQICVCFFITNRIHMLNILSRILKNKDKGRSKPCEDLDDLNTNCETISRSRTECPTSYNIPSDLKLEWWSHAKEKNHREAQGTTSRTFNSKSLQSS